MGYGGYQSSWGKSDGKISHYAAWAAAGVGRRGARLLHNRRVGLRICLRLVESPVQGLDKHTQLAAMKARGILPERGGADVRIAGYATALHRSGLRSALGGSPGYGDDLAVVQPGTLL